MVLTRIAAREGLKILLWLQRENQIDVREVEEDQSPIRITIERRTF